MRTFSIKQARQIALSAQGFDEPRPSIRAVGLEDFERVMRKLNIVQIDTINVLVRAQYMPFFSRLGPYPLEMLHQYAYEERQLFEYYAHAAALTPMEHVPLLRHRMNEWPPWQGWDETMAENPGLIEATLENIRIQGPMEVSDFEFKGERLEYWVTSTIKLILETMLFQGKLTVSDRINSARRYDFIERVVPKNILEINVSREDAHRQMMKLAVSSLGIGTTLDLSDYYRIKRVDATKAIKHLVSTGEIEQVKVDGINKDLFAVPGIEPPVKPIDARAILSPFDPVTWCRNRLGWLFDFEYRIEIYLPAKKRKYGYYVMPFLLGDRLAARVDLKADRAKSVLRVPSAFLEAGCDEEHVAEKLASELRVMADWLQLDRIVVGRRGGLVRALRSAVKRI